MASPFLYFTDAVLRAPTIGCMLMCLSAAIVGVIAFLRKQSLVGESISHAAYPGVVIGVAAAGVWMGDSDAWLWLPQFTIIGAFLTAFLGLLSIRVLISRWKIHPDAALCLILSVFFGVGITLASRIQFTHTSLYVQSLSYLYGQPATMTDIHILIYGSLSIISIGVVLLFYKELHAITFDRNFARCIGINVELIEFLVILLIAIVTVVGIRSVGVVLMSAMLIAPAAAARQYTHRFSIMMVIAGLFGLLSGFLGNYLSVELSNYLMKAFPSARLALPTGPMIVLVITLICVLSILLAPERGLLIRIFRIAKFRFQCVCENVLKTMWRINPSGLITIKDIQKHQEASSFYLRLILSRLSSQGWVEKIKKNSYALTQDGIYRAEHIVRLHRLWEVYLADYVGVGSDRVHRSAEEMEHILTPDLEQELTELLKNPTMDPHHQPIPQTVSKQGLSDERN